MGFVAIPPGAVRLRRARTPQALLEAAVAGPVDADGLIEIDLEIRGGRIAAVAPAGSFPGAGARELQFGQGGPLVVDPPPHLQQGPILPRAATPDRRVPRPLTT